MPTLRRILALVLGLLLVQGSLAQGVLACATADGPMASGMMADGMPSSMSTAPIQLPAQSSGHHCQHPDMARDCLAMSSCTAVGALVGSLASAAVDTPAGALFVWDDSAPASRSVIPEVPPPRV